MSAPSPLRDRRSDLRPGRIALAYCVISLAWIYGSGYVVATFSSGGLSNVLESLKGTGFVLVTAGALYVILARRARSIRRAEEERLAANEERLRLATAVEQAAEAILVTDPTSRIVYVNPALEQISGYSRTELVGNDPSMLVSTEARSEDGPAGARWPDLTGSEIWRGTLLNARKDGLEYEVETVVSPIRSDGKLVNYVAVMRDVSRERTLERELAEAGRMEAVAVLAGGIAHDFNNQLTAITGFAELLRQDASGNAAAQSDVDEVLRASRSATSLVKQLLALARRQMLEPKGIALDELVEQLTPMLMGLLDNPRIALHVECDEPIRPVFADARQIEQVLANLTVNARDAMPNGGVYTLSISNVEIGGGDDRAALMRPGSYVLLQATDTGVGMDDATRAHVFDPFFTTKPAGHGTGLGLATTYGIVTQSNGYLFVQSELGHGSTFSIYLPQHKGPVSGHDSAARPEPLPGGTETVLVVEDEPAVREFVTQSLRRLGYRVLVSPDASAAIEAAAAESEAGGDLPLLVTDIRLPGQDGTSLAAAMRETHPGLRVLYVSGYAGDAMVKSGLVGQEEAFLGKPFTAEDLARRVRSLLDA